MNNLLEKKILLIICGGISAYKSLELIRLLKKQGAKLKLFLLKVLKNLLHLYQLLHFLKKKFMMIYLMLKMKLKWIIFHFLDGQM